MNGSATQTPTGSLGSIKDRVRKANGAVTGQIPSWRTDWRAKVEDDGTSDAKASEKNTVKGKDVTENKGDMTAPPQQGDTAQTHSEVTTHLKPDCNESISGNAGKGKYKEKERQPKTKSPGSNTKPQARNKNDYKEISRQIDEYDPKDETGIRHWIFLPDEVAAAIKLAHGDKKLSSALCVLARRYVESFRDDMRKDIIGRIGMLSE